MITVSTEAQAYLKEISESNGGQIPLLGLKGGGCAGFSYTWLLKDASELDGSSNGNVIIKMDNEQSIALDESSLMYLFGSEIVLKKDLFGTTLDVVAQAAKSSCGCGESVNFDMEKVEDNLSQIRKLN